MTKVGKYIRHDEFSITFTEMDFYRGEWHDQGETDESLGRSISNKALESLNKGDWIEMEISLDSYKVIKLKNINQKIKVHILEEQVAELLDLLGPQLTELRALRAEERERQAQQNLRVMQALRQQQATADREAAEAHRQAEIQELLVKPLPPI